jgi:hypothetical protein
MLGFNTHRSDSSAATQSNQVNSAAGTQPAMAMPTELQPVNIQRLLKQNDKFAEASQYAKSITTGSVVAAWHDTGASSAATKSAAAGSSQQEAMLQKKELQDQRKQRLKHLLEQERLALESELQQRGLALMKHRD